MRLSWPQQEKMEELQRFGTHTRQRKAGLTELARKWMVLHSGGGAPAYALVANDWALMEARTHSPPLASYLEPVERAVDPATFVWIAKNGFAHAHPLSEQEAKDWPHLAQMCETLWPRPIGEEAWQDWERRDHWKERAYFLATMGSRARPQFYGMVEAIYRDGTAAGQQEGERDTIADLYTKLQRYGATPSHWPSARELGSLISTMNLDHVEAGVDCVEARRLYLEEKQREKEEAARVEETIENAAPVAMELEPIRLAEKTKAATAPLLDQHEGLRAFRQRHLIPPTFDQRATAKQLVLASLGAAVPSTLMASAQRRAFGSFVKPEAGECNAELVDALLNDVSHAQLGGLNLVSPAIQTYYWSQPDCETVTAHEFVGRLIGEYTNGSPDSDFRKNYPTPDESLIKIITEF